MRSVVGCMGLPKKTVRYGRYDGVRVDPVRSHAVSLHIHLHEIIAQHVFSLGMYMVAHEAGRGIILGKIRSEIGPARPDDYF